MLWLLALGSSLFASPSSALIQAFLGSRQLNNQFVQRIRLLPVALGSWLLNSWLFSSSSSWLLALG
jgi:hypothetical protein